MRIIRIEELVPLEGNVERGRVVGIARKIIKARRDVMAYVKDSKSPIDVCTVDDNLLVTDGNHTVAACFVLGIETVPCRVDQYSCQTAYSARVQQALAEGYKGFAGLPVVTSRHMNKQLGTLLGLGPELAKEAERRK